MVLARWAILEARGSGRHPPETGSTCSTPPHFLTRSPPVSAHRLRNRVAVLDGPSCPYCWYRRVALRRTRCAHPGNHPITQSPSRPVAQLLRALAGHVHTCQRRALAVKATSCVALVDAPTRGGSMSRLQMNDAPVKSAILHCGWCARRTREGLAIAADVARSSRGCASARADVRCFDGSCTYPTPSLR